MRLIAVSLLLAASAAAEDRRESQPFWSLQPMREPSIPAVRDAAWPGSDIDRFVLAQLEQIGLRPADPASKRALIRRATFDLIGLPPTPEEIDAFLADESPDAFARVVDRLLASPHYGERWGRHWLDLVRYADTAGDNSDYPVPQIFKYRNWVIRAFNDDKPYDQLLREQIAGDLMPAVNEAERFDKLTATGYLANARRFGSVLDGYPWHLTIEDTIDNLGRSVLGVTVNCARCHDHKFDPITTEDYYALYGFFASTRYPWPGIELDKVPRDLVPLVSAAEAEASMKERGERLAALDAAVKQLEEERAAAEKSFKEAEEAAKSPTKDPAAADERAKLVTQTRQRVESLGKALQESKKERERLAKSPLPFETAYAVVDGAKIENARVQVKGDPASLGKEVPRRFLEVLGGQSLPADVSGSGRLQLAEWLTNPHNPLTARVMVNRIWTHHFGKGIVKTPSDFGKQGHPPTHPELLDYLARRFIGSGWSIKAMHRLIMLSSTYQLSSAERQLALSPARSQREPEAGPAEKREQAETAQLQSADPRLVDPNNDYLWKFPQRRLDAESIRDAMLAVSGELDRTPGGPHPFPDQTTWDFTQHKPFKAVYDSKRRSVYLMTQRIQRHPYLGIFDGPDTNASTAQRITSTTPLQALYLMNDPFVHEQAAKFAARLIAARPDDAGRLDLAYSLALGRSPTPPEREAVAAYLSQLRERLIAAGTPAEQLPQASWESFARAVFRMNEFVYVD